MTFTINKECSKWTIKVRRNSAKTCPKLTKTSKQYDRHCCGIPAVKFAQVPHPVQCFYYIPWTDICMQSSGWLIFKILGKRKRSILNVDPKK